MATIIVVVGVAVVVIQGLAIDVGKVVVAEVVSRLVVLVAVLVIIKLAVTAAGVIIAFALVVIAVSKNLFFFNN